MRLLDALERRIKTNLNKNKDFKGRGIDIHADYREGYCNALRAVLRRIDKMRSASNAAAEARRTGGVDCKRDAQPPLPPAAC